MTAYFLRQDSQPAHGVLHDAGALLDLMTVPAGEIRLQNAALNALSRENAAWIGALWHTIEVRTLWQEWGYATFTACLEEEQERGYSTVMESVRNYRYFVLDAGLPFAEFVQLVIQLGVKKTSILRQTTRQRAAACTNLESGREENPALEAAHGIQAAAERLATMSKREAQQAHPTTVYDVVYCRFRLSREGYALLQAALADICKRADRQISQEAALELLVGEYCAEKAVRGTT